MIADNELPDLSLKPKIICNLGRYAEETYGDKDNHQCDESPNDQRIARLNQSIIQSITIGKK
jgi:hypothetical protein